MAESGQKPLSFVRSIPANGASGVSTRLTSIKLMFDKNVVDDSVWANNKTQIKLWEGAQKLPMSRRITRKSAFSERNNIYIKTLKTLKPFTQYKVHILPGLTAKNKQKLGKSVIITFTTGGNGVVPTPIIPEE